MLHERGLEVQKFVIKSQGVKVSILKFEDEMLGGGREEKTIKEEKKEISVLEKQGNTIHHVCVGVNIELKYFTTNFYDDKH